MPMAFTFKATRRKGDHMGRVRAKANDAEFAIAVASAVPLAAIIAFALGCYVGLSVTGVFLVSFLFTVLLTVYAVTVRALCREHRRRSGR